MKFVRREITVEGQGYRPRRLFIDNEIINVRSRLDFWVVQSNWWSGDTRRIYLLLETDAGILEVYTDGCGRWVLFRRQD